MKRQGGCEKIISRAARRNLLVTVYMKSRSFFPIIYLTTIVYIRMQTQSCFTKCGLLLARVLTGQVVFIDANARRR